MQRAGMTTGLLWTVADPMPWTNALDRYGAEVEAQGVASLPAHDAWYHAELGPAIRARTPRHVVLSELSRLTEWKMARGVWRARNLVLVRGNAPDDVVQASTEAFALVPHPTKAIARLATLAGVGPATASAVLAAAEPDHYPFFDELVANQIPDLGPVKYTLSYYARYSEALRERASALGSGWTPAAVEHALWAYAGGKRGAHPTSEHGATNHG